MVYTPDGKHLLSCESSTVRFFDTGNGQEVRRIELPGNEFYRFVLSPDGKTLATVGSERPTVTTEVRLWDVGTGKEVRRVAITIVRKATAEGVPVVAFTPDGKTFAMARSSGVIRLWDMTTWQEKRPLTIEEDSLSFHFLPDGKTLISVANDGIRWRDIGTLRELRRVDKKLSNKTDVAVSPDSKRLAVLGQTDVIYLFDAASGKEVRRIALGSESDKWTRSACFCFSPDSQTLAYSAWSTKPRETFQTVFIAADTGRELRRWGVRCFYMAYSPDGKNVAHVNQLNTVIDIRDAMTGRPAVDVQRLPESVMSVHFTVDGKTLIACCRDGQVCSWDPLTGKRLAPYQAPPDHVGKPQIVYLHATSFTADGKTAALVDDEGVLHVWEPATGKARRRIEGQATMGGYADFSPDGKLLVVDDKDHALGLWDVASGERIRLLARFCQSRVFSADGRFLATYTQGDKMIRLWETTSGKELRQLAWQGGPSVMRLAFSPDGTCLVSTHSVAVVDRVVGNNAFIDRSRAEESFRVWDIASGRQLSCFPARVGLVDWTQSPVISADSRTLATAEHDIITLWELATGKERARFTGHRRSVYSLSFSHNGRLLASGSFDHTALIWDVTGVCPDGELPARDIQLEELKRLWADLGGSDGIKAYSRPVDDGHGLTSIGPLPGRSSSARARGCGRTDCRSHQRA